MRALASLIMPVTSSTTILKLPTATISNQVFRLVLPTATMTPTLIIKPVFRVKSAVLA